MNLGGHYAQARDSGTVTVDVPPPYVKRQVEFLALIERLEVTPDAIARVVVNERTGTIIMGQDVSEFRGRDRSRNITVSPYEQKIQRSLQRRGPWARSKPSQSGDSGHRGKA